MFFFSPDSPGGHLVSLTFSQPLTLPLQFLCLSISPTFDKHQDWHSSIVLAHFTGVLFNLANRLGDKFLIQFTDRRRGFKNSLW